MARPPLTLVWHAQIMIQGTLTSLGASAKSPTTVFTYARTNTAVDPTKTALNTAFVAGPLAAILLATSDKYVNVSPRIRWIEDAEDPYVLFPQTNAGAITTPRLPSYVAVYMNKRSNSRARWANGSWHFPGANEIDTTDDLLTGAGLTRWQAVQAACLANITDATGNVWQPVVVAGPPNSQTRTNPTIVVSNSITAIILDLTVGRMKKRQVRTVV